MSACALWFKAQSFNDQIWLLEHPTSLYTLVTAADPAHVLNPGDIPVIQTDRGGEVTFHGPGQLVIYFLLDIKQKKIGPKTLVANLQNLIQNILQHYSIESSFIEGAPGVYVGGEKNCIHWFENFKRQNLPWHQFKCGYGLSTL